MGEIETAARSSMIESVLPHSLELPAQELIKLWETDNSSVKVWEVVNNHSDFCKQGALIYRKWRPPGRGEESVIEQFVLHKECRRKVLELGHQILLAGHLGVEKTRQWVLRRYYWPTIFKDIKNSIDVVNSARSQIPVRLHQLLLFHSLSSLNLLREQQWILRNLYHGADQVIYLFLLSATMLLGIQKLSHCRALMQLMWLKSLWRCLLGLVYPKRS